MINNTENPGTRELFSASVLPFQESRPFYFPDETRINNLEE